MALRRREWLKTFAGASVGALGWSLRNRTHAQTTAPAAAKRAVAPLALKDYQPKSMLHVPETHVPRSRFPNIDFHTHLTWVDRKGNADVLTHAATVEEALKVMDAKNIRIMVNLTGGYGPLLEQIGRAHV